MRMIQVSSIEEGVQAALDAIDRGENRDWMGHSVALRVERNVYSKSAIFGKIFVTINDVYDDSVVKPLAVIGVGGSPVKYYE